MNDSLLKQIIDLLSQLVKGQSSLQARLAPGLSTRETTHFAAIIASTVQRTPVHGPYNAIQNGITAGTLCMAFGSPQPNAQGVIDDAMADYEFNAVPSPLPIPFERRFDKNVTFWAKSDTSNPVVGSIALINT